MQRVTARPTSMFTFRWSTRKLAALLVSALFLRTVEAADAPALFPIRQNGKFGYINAAGQVVIPPRFFQIDSNRERHFLGDLQAVWIGDRAGYIDGTGKVVIGAEFTLALPFSENLASVRSATGEGKWGYIDKGGQYVIPPSFDEAMVFSEGLAQIVVKGKMGYIDKSGSFVISPRYPSYSPCDSTFSEGLACVPDGERWSFINKEGKTVIDAKFESPSSFHDGLAVGQKGEKFSRRWGYIDKTGTFAIAPRFSLAWRFSEGLARVREETGAMSFVDTKGNVVFTMANGQWAGEFSEGLVNVQSGKGSGQETWGYVDRLGKWVIPPRFLVAEPFYKGLAQVVVGGKAAYIDKTGKYVWGPDSGNEPLLTKFRKQQDTSERANCEAEILRLAKLIDPTEPPITAEMLRSGGVNLAPLEKAAQSGSSHARTVLELLLSFAPSGPPMEQFAEMAAIQVGEFHCEVARALVRVGDPFVLPTLRTWLTDALKVDGEVDVFSRDAIKCALEGFAQFQERDAVKQMQSVVGKPEVEKYTREAAVSALADLAVSDSKNTLLEALKDSSYSEAARCKIAGGLVRMGEGAGRQFLMDTYSMYLDSLRQRTSDHGIARSELEFLGDSELINTLKSKAGAEPPGVPRNNINTLLDLMLVAALPVEQLKATALKAGEENLTRRLHAIQVMGREGELDLVPFLESLRSAPDDYSHGDFNQMRRYWSDDAIRRIRSRHWRESTQIPPKAQ